MATTAPTRSKVSFRDLLVLGIVVAALIGIMTHEGRSPVASAETQFVEHSARGLQIVPASCASVPDIIPESWAEAFGYDTHEHYPGECSPDPEDPEDPENPDNPENPGGPGTPPSIPPGPGNTCPIGYTLCIGNQCSEQNYGRCVYSGCPDGFRLEGGQCVPNAGAQCGGFFCSGSDLYERYQSNGQCLSRMNQRCAFGCSAGGCIAAPPGEGNITVSPALIRSGESTTVTWTTNGMVEDSCTVSDNNPDIAVSDTRSSGSLVAGPIRQQTSFTIRCTKQDESIFSDSATVNIIPVFQED